MSEKIAVGTFILLVYLLIGFGFNLMLGEVYDTDIPLGSMFLWSIIIVIVAIFDVIKITRKLIKTIKDRR